MNAYSKVNEDGTYTILEAVRVNGEIIKSSDPRFVDYAHKDGFEETVIEGGLPSAEEIDDMSRGEKDEVLKKILRRL